MWSQRIGILFESYRFSVLSAEQIFVVRSSSGVELQLRSLSGNVVTILRGRY